MIGLGRRVPVFRVCRGRRHEKSFDTLGAIVREHTKHDILEGALFVFVSRDCRRAKVLVCDGALPRRQRARRRVPLSPPAWTPGERRVIFT